MSNITLIKPLNNHNEDFMSSTPLKQMAVLNLRDSDFALLDHDPKIEDFVTNTVCEQPFENNDKKKREFYKKLLKLINPAFNTRFNLQEYCQAQAKAQVKAATKNESSASKICVIRIKKKNK